MYDHLCSPIVTEGNLERCLQAFCRERASLEITLKEAGKDPGKNLAFSVLVSPSVKTRHNPSLLHNGIVRTHQLTCLHHEI